MKNCSKCKIKQDEFNFFKDVSSKDSLSSQCKSCRKTKREDPEIKKRNSERSKQWLLDNPNYHKDYWKEYIKTDHGQDVRTNGKLKRLYNITLEEYDQMFEDQNGKCKICGTEENGNKRFSVDHDHETEKVRGLLCYRCNTSLGWFENNKDNVLIYLEGDINR